MNIRLQIQTNTQNIHKKYLNSNRSITLDILKGVAIFCVVWGHLIEQGTLPEIIYRDNPIFQLIYSFHMPLFMMISGYLMYNSIQKRTLIQQYLYWGKTLVIPLLVWTIIANIIIIITHYVATGDIITLNLTSIEQYWYIFALLICGILATLLKKVCADKTIAYILITLIFFITTFNLFGLGWMLPFFVGGYLLKKHSTVTNQNLIKLTCISILIFPLLMMSYNNLSTIYLSVFNIGGFLTRGEELVYVSLWAEAISHNAYKILTGFAGCGFMYGIVKMLLKIKMPTITAILSWFGTYSLVIYFIQRIIIEILFGGCVIVSNIWKYDFAFTFVLAIISTTIFASFGTLIKKNKSLNMILCGGR